MCDLPALNRVNALKNKRIIIINYMHEGILKKTDPYRVTARVPVPKELSEKRWLISLRDKQQQNIFVVSTSWFWQHVALKINMNYIKLKDHVRICHTISLYCGSKLSTKFCLIIALGFFFLKNDKLWLTTDYRISLGTYKSFTSSDQWTYKHVYLIPKPNPKKKSGSFQTWFNRDCL